MESFCAGPEAPGAVNGGISFWLVQKKCPRTPKEKIALGGGREVAGPVRRQVEVAEVGWPCPSPTAHNSLRSRRCRTASGGRARSARVQPFNFPQASAASAGIDISPAAPGRKAQRAVGEGAVIRLRRLRSRRVTAECAFFGAPLPFLSHTGKEMGWNCHAQGPPLRQSAEK